ncbi:unnamed protein product, partial [Prorocentrum cordatum]
CSAGAGREVDRRPKWEETSAPPGADDGPGDLTARHERVKHQIRSLKAEGASDAKCRRSVLGARSRYHSQYMDVVRSVQTHVEAMGQQRRDVSSIRQLLEEGQQAYFNRRNGWSRVQAAVKIAGALNKVDLQSRRTRTAAYQALLGGGDGASPADDLLRGPHRRSLLQADRRQAVQQLFCAAARAPPARA